MLLWEHEIEESLIEVEAIARENSSNGKELLLSHVVLRVLFIHVTRHIEIY